MSSSLYKHPPSLSKLHSLFTPSFTPSLVLTVSFISVPVSGPALGMGRGGLSPPKRLSCPPNQNVGKDSVTNFYESIQSRYQSVKILYDINIIKNKIYLYGVDEKYKNTVKYKHYKKYLSIWSRYQSVKRLYNINVITNIYLSIYLSRVDTKV